MEGSFFDEIMGDDKPGKKTLKDVNAELSSFGFDDLGSAEESKIRKQQLIAFKELMDLLLR